VLKVERTCRHTVKVHQSFVISIGWSKKGGERGRVGPPLGYKTLPNARGGGQNKVMRLEGDPYRCPLSDGQKKKGGADLHVGNFRGKLFRIDKYNRSCVALLCIY